MYYNFFGKYDFFFVECSFGLFGDKCKSNCSKYCYNNDLCDYISGVCLKGCMDGYIGVCCDNCKMYIVDVIMEFILLFV